jgi:hypothetical protein
MHGPTPVQQYSDNSLDSTRMEECLLRVQVSEDELQLAVFDYVTRQFLLVERYSLSKGFSGATTEQLIARILRQHSLLRLPFKQREAILISSGWNIIPNAFYQSGQAEIMLRSTRNIPEKARFLHSAFPERGFTLVGSFPEITTEVLEAELPGLQKVFYLKPLLEQIFLNETPQSVYVFVQDFRADLIAVMDGKLRMANTFRFQTPEEFVYFVILAYDALEWSRDLCALTLCGDIEAGSALYQSAYKYIRHISFLQRPEEPAVPADVKTGAAMPPHFFLNLLYKPQ